jgi:hypothetical protein
MIDSCFAKVLTSSHFYNLYIMCTHDHIYKYSTIKLNKEEKINTKTLFDFFQKRRKRKTITSSMNKARDDG